VCSFFLSGDLASAPVQYTSAMLHYTKLCRGYCSASSSSVSVVRAGWLQGLRPEFIIPISGQFCNPAQRTHYKSASASICSGGIIGGDLFASDYISLHSRPRRILARKMSSRYIGHSVDSIRAVARARAQEPHSIGASGSSELDTGGSIILVLKI
jgi:hypothetical protein